MCNFYSTTGLADQILTENVDSFLLEMFASTDTDHATPLTAGNLGDQVVLGLTYNFVGN